VWEREEEVEREGTGNRGGASISNEFDIDPAADDIGMKGFRDRLAQQMWIDYQTYVNR